MHVIQRVPASAQPIAFVAGELGEGAVGGAAVAEGGEVLGADDGSVRVGDEAGGAEVVEVIGAAVGGGFGREQRRAAPDAVLRPRKRAAALLEATEHLVGSTAQGPERRGRGARGGGDHRHSLVTGVVKVGHVLVAVLAGGAAAEVGHRAGRIPGQGVGAGRIGRRGRPGHEVAGGVVGHAGGQAVRRAVDVDRHGDMRHHARAEETAGRVLGHVAEGVIRVGGGRTAVDHLREAVGLVVPVLPAADLRDVATGIVRVIAHRPDLHP